jgi:hypothetical protein
MTFGAHHRDAQQVGLELHQQVVDAGAAVHAQLATGAPPAATASRLIACSSAALW